MVSEILNQAKAGSLEPDDIKAALASRLLNKGPKRSGHETVVPAGPGKGDGGPKNGGGFGAQPGPGYGAQAREHLLEERRWKFAAGLYDRSLRRGRFTG